MQCFSLVTKPVFVRGAPAGCNGPCRGGSSVPLPLQHLYPQSRKGIDLDPVDRTVVIGNTVRIPVSRELLDLSPESKAIDRDGQRVTLLRASVERSDSGAVRLVPEKAEDREGAIVYLDIGTGKHTSLHFRNLEKQLRAEQVLARVRIKQRFGNYDEKLLVRLRAFEPLSAIRTDRRFWVWGEERIRERLKIRYDGRSLFYDMPQNDEATT